MKPKPQPKSSSRKPAKRRAPPAKIPLSFNQAVKGLLGLSSEDAKAVREAADKKK
jgi:hypothetical protein